MSFGWIKLLYAFGYTRQKRLWWNEYSLLLLFLYYFSYIILQVLTFYNVPEDI